MQSWSIILFFHNEAENIQAVCQQTMDFLSSLSEQEKEIICVDDGSTDKSNEQVRKMIKGKPYAKLITHQKN